MTLLGAVVGDIVGAPFEAPRARIKTTDFPLFSAGSRFTDDTVLTVATAKAILFEDDYRVHYRRMAQAYPRAGYGDDFWAWTFDPSAPPYGSWGNGSAMRVSPIGMAAQTLEQALSEAALSASVTHNHPEGVRGAQAVALAVFLARAGASKDAIRERVRRDIGYPLVQSLDDIRPTYAFDVSCQGSVPESITAFLEAQTFEEAIRLAVSLGGDADTQASIAGGIAGAFWGVPEDLAAQARTRLDPGLLGVIETFCAAFPQQGTTAKTRN